MEKQLSTECIESCHPRNIKLWKIMDFEAICAMSKVIGFKHMIARGMINYMSYIYVLCLTCHME